MSERSVDKGVSERKAWAFLALAGCFEPLWVVSMKLSEGFTDIPWVTATFIFLTFSMYFLALALKGKLAMGTAYSVWVGIGAIGALIAGILLFDESSDPLRLGFVALIIVGIVGLQVTAKERQ
ncbi:MAG: multidrug efflux SMR transporter [Methanomassiliicoccales archaeon]|nr:multidrug efflux SMR transporter [Methanomassiliicoccales archaeon]